MSLSIFLAIFDLIAAAGSHLRVTTALSSSPCMLDTRCSPSSIGRIHREAGDAAATVGKMLVLSIERLQLYYFLRKIRGLIRK